MKIANELFAIVSFALLVTCSATAFGRNTALSLRTSSLGIGIEVTRSVTSTINGRVGLNYFAYSYEGQNQASSIEYNLDYNMLSLSALADWFPFKGEFHFSGGILYNSNKIEGVGKPVKTYLVGGKRYTPEKLGALTVTVEPDLKLSPYLGLGWGNAVRANKKLGFSVDIGVIYQGSPDVTLTASGLLEPTAEQEPDVENDIKNLKFYPVISLGLTYQF